jgi:AraC-like DNA-binding protein
MIEALAATLSWSVVAVALVAVLWVLRGKRKTDAELLFAVFCGSVALSILRPQVDTDPAWLWWLVAVGGCATCNVYWLLARALFRGDGAVGRTHIAVAGGIAFLIVAYRVASRDPLTASGWLAPTAGSLLTLASSIVLGLAFLEALRGDRALWTRAERHLRLGFVAVFGGCVLVGTVCAGLAEALPAVAALRPAVNAGCALAIIAYTAWALAQRRLDGSGTPVDASAAAARDLPPIVGAAPDGPRVEDLGLASAIRRLLDDDAIYREPELKVADLAARLGSAEHKVSRAITQVIGARNFNQLINQYRIEHACRLLEDGGEALSVIEVCHASGFASLGPFNRAFKARMGCTPSAWRAGRRLGGVQPLARSG